MRKWRGFLIESWYYRTPKTLADAFWFFVHLPVAWIKWTRLSGQTKKWGIRQWLKIK